MLNPVSFQKALLSWYDHHKRDLPWRRTKDPYAIFLSEMMLQQTQVQTVIPYYLRFLNELPDWKALAKAKEEKVLKLWEGLGYYRRARNLQAAARKVLGDFGGFLPDSLGQILQIPGVGPYSAGAILSIVFQKPYPVVDGNVLRVLSRFHLLKGPLKTGQGQQKVWGLAEELISRRRPGDFNQALMELGATVCLPKKPLCLLCPLVSACQAFRNRLQNEFPEKDSPPATVEIPMAALLIERKGRVLVKKRSKEERWLKGLWEFPSAEGNTFSKALRALEKSLNVKADWKVLREIRHQITHHKIRLRLFKAQTPKMPLPQGFKWVAIKKLDLYPFPSAQDKLRQWVLKETEKSNHRI